MSHVSDDVLNSPLEAETTKKIVDVAVGLIVKNGQALLAKRAEHQHQGGRFEFPGGKVEAGELVTDALVRELHEELGIHIHIGQSLPASTHHYPTFVVTLYPFVCTIESGEIVLHEHAAVTWLPPDELHTLDWAEADVPVIESYLAETGIDCP